MIYKKWDVIQVFFPFTDFKSSKKRSALIVSPEKYNQEEDLVIAFITSNITGKSRMGDYMIHEW